jgi:predicted P-loop ATPase
MIPIIIDTESAIAQLIDAGFALHWLHPKSKVPIGEDWSNKPVATKSQLRERYLPGCNLGVRLGFPVCDGKYLHVIDVDIRDPAFAADAMAKLEELIPGLSVTAPSVISGSGGASRHFYFSTDIPLRSRKLARSATFTPVYEKTRHRDVKKRDWEIELFGVGKQVVLPPSVHPETGLPYKWERPIDLDLLAAGIFSPAIPIEQLEGSGALHQQNEVEGPQLKPPLGLTEEEAESYLDDLPFDQYCEDRDGWLQVGMALHHEFGGDELGYDLWKDFSERSDKFNEKDQRLVWNSFRNKPNSVRMATLVSVAKQMRLLRSFEEIDGEESVEGCEIDIEALIGGSSPPIPSTASTCSESSEEGGSWVSRMQLTSKGMPVSNLHNLELILRNDPRFKGLAQFNEFTQDTVQRTLPRRHPLAESVVQLTGSIWNVTDRLNGGLWTDSKDYALRACIEAPRRLGGYGIRVSDRDLYGAISIAAREYAFHPVREYLERTRWDGRHRVERLFVDYLGAEPNPYTFGVARLMMLAAVTRIYEPGHKFDFAVILEGGQGRRKSTFIQVLGQKWSGELDGDFHDPRSMIELMQGKWILELPELSGFARADVRAIKAFISRHTDRARLAYAKHAIGFPRQCIFIGSTNDHEYLKDETGGRRFWPMPCHLETIDTERLSNEVDQLWAEALTIYRHMRSNHPAGDLPLYLTDPDAQKIANRLQESRRVQGTEEDYVGIIQRWLECPINDGGFADRDADRNPRYRQRVCLPEIWMECLGGDMKQYPQATKTALGRAMAKMPGWEKIGTRNCGKYGPQKTYERIEDVGHSSSERALRHLAERNSE